MLQRSCARYPQKRTTQSKIFCNNATTAALVKPCGSALVNGSSQRRYELSPHMVSRARSIFDGEALADFVHALVERIEPRMNRTVMEIEDVAAGEEREDPVVMLDITEDRLDGLANECDHAPHKFHCTSSRHASASVAGVLCASGNRYQNLAWLLFCE